MTTRSLAPDRPAVRALNALIERNTRSILGPYLRRVAQASVAAAMIGGCSGTSGPEIDSGQIDGGSLVDAGPLLDSGSQADAGGDAGARLDASAPDGARPDAAAPDAWVPPPSSELCLDGAWLAVAGLSPVESPPHYLAALAPPDFRGLPYIVHEIGERCGDAADRTTCLSDVARLESETYARALLSTDGDAARARTTAEEVRAFLGAIDTVNEAALLVWQAGYDIRCAGEHLSSVTQTTAGSRVIAYRDSGGCGSPYVTTRYVVKVEPDGRIEEESATVVAEVEDWGCIGRRPAGLRAAEAGARDGAAVGAFFANVARLEASAVAAFDVMIDELAALGAPDALVDAAKAARADEVRHTGAMSGLARRFGAEPLVPVVDAMPPRSAFEIALENAVEGCVRETFGALVGAHQALRAGDASVREAMRAVSEDEIRHAELSWALAGWLEPQLGADERARIEQARREAIRALREEASVALDPTLIELAGLPDPSTTVAMVEQLSRDLWA